MRLKTLPYLSCILVGFALLHESLAELPPDPVQKIGHIIVISLENHSFDNLFGNFPGAEGLSKVEGMATQTDADGTPYETLPRIPDRRFPSRLPNAPFPIDNYVAVTEKIGDLVHRFYQQQAQINGGKMDHFALVSDAGGLTMGYYDGSQTGLWQLAQRYTLADHFFHAAFGGSFLNHFWLVCACTPRFEHAPKELVAEVDAHGAMVKDGAVTPEFDAVNTLYPTATPHPAKADASHALPPQTLPTIGDRLSEKGIGWAWYSGGWNHALAGKPDKSFQFHHQPFAYFKAYADGTDARREHLKDEADLLQDLAQDTLPPVVFYKPLGEFNLHPGYADMASGDAHVMQIVQAIQASSAWKDSVIIITFDENGGFWDHVAPPKGDRFGPGARVPTIIVSPLAKRGFVDHTVYDTTSILRLIERRYGLAPLGERDAKAKDLTNALELR